MLTARVKVKPVTLVVRDPGLKLAPVGSDAFPATLVAITVVAPVTPFYRRAPRSVFTQTGVVLAVHRRNNRSAHITRVNTKALPIAIAEV